MSSLHILFVICSCVFVSAKPNTKCLNADMQLHVMIILWARGRLGGHNNRVHVQNVSDQNVRIVKPNISATIGVHVAGRSHSKSYIEVITCKRSSILVWFGRDACISVLEKCCGDHRENIETLSTDYKCKQPVLDL